MGDEPVARRHLDDLLDTVRLVEDAAGERASYFEILTAAALRLFADVAVDVAVVEVGLGGTWDATTSSTAGSPSSRTSASITSSTSGRPAPRSPTEKAGIVKSGSTLVLGETDPDLESIFVGRRPQRSCAATCPTSGPRQPGCPRRTLDRAVDP